MSTTLSKRHTPQEYLERERSAPYKSEYCQGEIVIREAASFAHSLITGNIIGEFGSQLKGRSCTTHSSDLRIKVPQSNLYTYPDASVICGEPQFDDACRETVLNPTLLVEVLSDSKEKYDRGKKFEHYRKLDSLKQYMLIEQDHPHVDVYTKQDDGNWVLSDATGLESSINFTSIGCQLALAEIYDRVTFPPQDLSKAGIFTP